MSAFQDIYSINVSNRFALGVEEESNDEDELIDPVEQLKKIEEQRQRERELKKQIKQQQANKKVPRKAAQDHNKDANIKKNADQETKSAAPKPAAPRGQRRNDENQRPPRRRTDQNTDRYAGGGAGDRYGESRLDGFPSNNKPDEGSRFPKRDKAERYDRFKNNRGNYRGNGGGRGNMRNNFRSDGRDDRGKREFDRRSGSDRSGVRATDKRDGGGSRNWGTPESELDVSQPAQQTTEEPENWADQADIEAAEKKPEKSDTEKETDAEKKPEDEENEENELTLDEWKALQNANAKKLEFNIRKPGEGEDNAKWGNMKVLHASAPKDSGAPGAGADSHRRQVKNFVEVDIRFNDLSRGQKGGRGRGGGPGGRGGGRYGERRGGGRGGNTGERGSYGGRGQQPPDVLNEAEFPTLPAA